MTATRSGIAYAPSRAGISSSGRASSPHERMVEALQPRVMGPRLAAAAGGGPRTCHVLDAKYEPGLRAVILYSHGERLLRGDLLASFEGSTSESVGMTSVVSPGVRICPFPYDPDLPSLPEVMDHTRLGAVLAGALDGDPRDRHGAARRRVTLLRYRPGKRATVLVTAGPRAEPVVAKVYHDPRKAAAAASVGSALSDATSTVGVLRLAPTVAYIPALSLVVQQLVWGTPLDALLGSARTSVGDAREAVRSAAQALAELHRMPLVSSRQRPVEAELERFGARARRIGTVDRPLGDRLGQLAERLIRVQAVVPEARLGLVHGDCKPSQFLVAPRQVCLLDLDHCGVADQAGDVGTFLASLRQLAVRQLLARRPPVVRGALDDLAGLFLETYLLAASPPGGDHETDRRIRWHEAVALERKALRSFARAPFSPLAGLLVTDAHRCLDRLVESA